MLVLKKELYFYEFKNEFMDELKDLPNEAISIIFDSLCELMNNGEYTVTNIRDYLRFQLQVMSLNEIIDSYGLDFEGLEGDELIEEVEDYLHYYTILLGRFEEDGETYFLFDEF